MFSYLNIKNTIYVTLPPRYRYALWLRESLRNSGCFKYHWGAPSVVGGQASELKENVSSWAEILSSWRDRMIVALDSGGQRSTVAGQPHELGENLSKRDLSLKEV